MEKKMIHELKILPQYFKTVANMTKPFEVRSEADRVFNVGDTLLLREYSGSSGHQGDHSPYYTGRQCFREVTYKLKLADDLVVLGLADTWIPVTEDLPPLLETVWLTNFKWVGLGCRVEEEGEWYWAESNGTTYIEDGRIVTECETEDLDVTHFHYVPKMP